MTQTAGTMDTPVLQRTAAPLDRGIADPSQESPERVRETADAVDARARARALRPRLGP